MSANNVASRRETTDAQPGLAPGTWAKLALAVLATAALITFLLQNRQDAEVNFLWFDWSTQMVWALLASALTGVVASALLTTLAARDRRK